MSARKLTMAQVARLAHVKRQAVFKWFKSADNYCNIRSQNLYQLAKGLNLSTDLLLEPLPWPDFKIIQAECLWDGLYATVEDFFVALVNFHYPAVARLVQSYGMFRAARILGEKVWWDFAEYKKYLLPKRREHCENLWKLQKDLRLI